MIDRKQEIILPVNSYVAQLLFLQIIVQPVLLNPEPFIAKISIVLEETDEPVFWLEFIKDEKLSNNENLPALITQSNVLYFKEDSKKQ